MEATETIFQNHYQLFLFWAHALFIVGAILLGLLISPLVALGLVLLHRLHIFLFGECWLSKVQRQAGGLPENMTFLQLAAQKFFLKKISLRESQILDYCLASLIIVVALMK